jgi:myo-inositol 2-dehydrogenase/D-chiro-inositol 1-dehydrogenase
MNDSQKPSRRDFLRRSAAVAGASLAGGLSLARNAHAALADDTIRVALIGCGGRGTGAAINCLNVSDTVKLVALADVFEERVQAARNAVKERHPNKIDLSDDRLFAGLDAYQKAIASGVDLVIMATPPGVRPPIFKAAVEAGKHVFTEKPLCTDAAGFRTLMETNKLADQKGLKIGVGLQRHHEPRYQETIKRIQDGAIGDLLFLRCYWNMGNIWTKARRSGDTELAYQLRNWQYFYYFGGDNITEQHIHNLDVCNWVMDDHPAEANGMGGRQGRDRFPDMGQTYDHHAVEYTFANGVKMFSQCRQMPDCWNQVAEFAHGTRGWADCSGKIMKGRGSEVVWQFRGETPNPYDQEHADLLKAIRNDEKYNEGWYGAPSSMTSVLGRIANYTGKAVRWSEIAEHGPAEAPELVSWDQKMPIMPDPDGTYKSSVAMPGVWKLG